MAEQNNTLDDEFKNFLTRMSCLSVLKVPYDNRCKLAKTAPDCKIIINFFNYFEMMYCTYKIQNKSMEIVLMLLFTLCVIIYMMLTGIIVNKFFTPVLKLLSVKMHMNEYLAGITLLTFGNCAPDLIGNLMPVRAEAAMFTRTASNAVAIILLCGGMVCFLKPFQMDGHCTVRDLLFLLLSVELVRFVIFKDGKVNPEECYFMLSFYFVYLFINIADLLLVRQTIKDLRLTIADLRQQPVTNERDLRLQKMLKILNNMEDHEDMSINKHNTKYFVRSSRPNYLRASDPTKKAFDTPMPQSKIESVDYKMTRTIFHNKDNSKNRFLFDEFFESLNPIDVGEWKFGNGLHRCIMIIKAPFVVFLTMLLPEVNYEKNKHGWSKLLNCTQIITNPFVFLTVTHSIYEKSYNGWIMNFNSSYSRWSFCLTVPLAIVVFLHSRTDLPPPYHSMFIVLLLYSAFVVISVCAAEIEVLTSIVGIVFNLSGDFMDITFGSVINAFSDLLSIFAMTMQGYEKMAFAAIFAGPFFSIVVGMGFPMLMNKKALESGSTSWLFGMHGENCYVFLVITIISTLIWCLTFNFFARRSAGIFYWIIFALFLLYACCVEFDVVHELTRDARFEPV